MCSAVFFSPILNYFVQCGRLTRRFIRKIVYPWFQSYASHFACVRKMMLCSKILLPGSGSFQLRLQFVVVETESKLRSLVRHLKSCCMTCLTLNNRSISGTGKVNSDSLTCGVCTFIQGRTRHARGFRMCYAIMKHRMLNLRGGRFFHMNRNRYILISMLNKRIICSMGM